MPEQRGAWLQAEVGESPFAPPLTSLVSILSGQPFPEGDKPAAGSGSGALLDDQDATLGQVGLLCLGKVCCSDWLLSQLSTGSKW